MISASVQKLFELPPIQQYIFAFALLHFNTLFDARRLVAAFPRFILPSKLKKEHPHPTAALLKPLEDAGLLCIVGDLVSLTAGSLTYEDHLAIFNSPLFKAFYDQCCLEPRFLKYTDNYNEYTLPPKVIDKQLEAFGLICTPSAAYQDNDWRQILSSLEDGIALQSVSMVLLRTCGTLDKLPSYLPKELNFAMLFARLHTAIDSPWELGSTFALLPANSYIRQKYNDTFFQQASEVLLGFAMTLSLRKAPHPEARHFYEEAAEDLLKIGSFCHTKSATSPARSAVTNIMRSFLDDEGRYFGASTAYGNLSVLWLCLATLPHLNFHPLLPKYPLPREPFCYQIFHDKRCYDLYCALASAIDTGLLDYNEAPCVPATNAPGILFAELQAAVYALDPSARPQTFTHEVACDLAKYANAIAHLGYRLPALVMLTALQEELADDGLATERQLLQELQSSCAFQSLVKPGFFKSGADILMESLGKIFPEMPADNEDDATAGKARTRQEYKLSWCIEANQMHCEDTDAPRWLQDFMAIRSVSPFIQKRRKNGHGWCTFKTIRCNTDETADLPATDQEGLKMIESPALLLPHLVGNDNLYLWKRKHYYAAAFDTPHEEELTSFQLVNAKPQLSLMTQVNGTLTLTNAFPVDFNECYYKPSGRIGYILRVADGHTPWQLLAVSAEYRQLAQFFRQCGKRDEEGHYTITIPASCKERFMKFLAPMANHFALSGNAIADTAAALEHREARTTLLLAIREVPDECGKHYDIRARFRIWESPELTAPIFGGDTSILLETDDGTFAVDRNLPEEKKLWEAFLAGCPSAADAAESRGHWFFEDIEPLLKLLEELPALEVPPILDWQNLPPITCRPAVCSFHASSGLNWFDIGAEIPIDESRVLSLAQLLAMLPGNTQLGNYIQVGDRQYLALTSKLRKTLAALRIGTAVKDDIRLGNAALPALLANLPDDDRASLLPSELARQLKKLREAMAVEPELPKGLQCTLREYQVDGYKWLSRLAAAGIGACLADDMGVGKTLQLLTLLLSRAGAGPSLVFAPASVCRNWVIEATRFTPGLQLTLLAESDREQAVKLAGPYDVLVISYGLLPTCAELLKTRQWNCLVLDEAQAIKNLNAQRSHLAKELPAAVRIASTGTPVENNLLEFWNIFDFLNPGLLGSHGGFTDRWMENGKLRPALRQLASPLLLRRMKADVLSELPPKTEVNLEVELSANERGLYEKLRQEALADIRCSAGDGSAALKILAHLTKLRRFCCHPTLTLKNLPADALPGLGSKLSQLIDVAQELKDAGHPALIFSQYVDMLALVREAFDKARYSYCYLDGATPSRTRQKEVERFQHGDVDFFLISLKAGGTGLNLTAANYVIILDPWWNPAVENQAADRTYRIGQRNPVTVYRLVTKATIEERVLELQEIKRDLATQLLDDQASTKLSPDMLMQLLKENS